MSPCFNPLPRFLPHSNTGIKFVNSDNQAFSISISWNQAYPDPQFSDGYIGYNIYYSTLKDEVFTEEVKAVSIDNSLGVNIFDFTPGDVFYFAVRGFQYNLLDYDPNLLPNFINGLKLYPESILLQDITDTQLSIPLLDASQFPNYGVVQIGFELIKYNSVILDGYVDGYLILNDISGRGFGNTISSIHGVNGFDGDGYRDPIVRFFKGFEEQNTVVLLDESDFDYPNFPYIQNSTVDGYRIITKDIINTDISQTEAEEEGRIRYDYSGWFRTDPAQLFDGSCLATYIGGDWGCANEDGYNSRIRGIPLNEVSNAREELLIGLTGDSCILVKRRWTGITCSCTLTHNENPQNRCPFCWGTTKVGGYDQYFNPRQSDGRIQVRFDPIQDSVKIDDSGLMQQQVANCWTLVTPAIHERDFIIRYFENTNTEIGRYEVLNVTRNNLMFGKSGAQKFTAALLDRTYTQYTWRVNPNTATVPTDILTGIGFVLGPNKQLIPHQHSVRVSETTGSLININSTTNVSQEHNHPIINGVVQSVLGHFHTLVYP